MTNCTHPLLSCVYCKLKARLNNISRPKSNSDNDSKNEWFNFEFKRAIFQNIDHYIGQRNSGPKSSGGKVILGISKGKLMSS